MEKTDDLWVKDEKPQQIGDVWHSPTLGKLFTALAAAQGEFSEAVRDAANPFFKSTYADIQSVYAACRPALSKHGLSLVQLFKGVVDGRVQLMSILGHSSGEYIGSTGSMRPVKDDPQGVGSALTYLRRYMIAAIAGVSQKDDDGNAASGNNGGRESGIPPPPPAPDRSALLKEIGGLLKPLAADKKQAVKELSFKASADEDIRAMSGLELAHCKTTIVTLLQQDDETFWGLYQNHLSAMKGGGNA